MTSSYNILFLRLYVIPYFLEFSPFGSGSEGLGKIRGEACNHQCMDKGWRRRWSPTKHARLVLQRIMFSPHAWGRAVDFSRKSRGWFIGPKMLVLVRGTLHRIGLWIFLGPWRVHVLEWPELNCLNIIRTVDIAQL